MQNLFLDVLRHYRREKKYSLHAFVMMPNHVHLLITPAPDITLEKCIQLIKGGFSFRAKEELKFKFPVWTQGFNEHHVKSRFDYERQVKYIHNNPVKARLVSKPEDYECSSAWPGRRMDPSPFGAGAKARSERARSSPG
jgi:putative transposase